MDNLLSRFNQLNILIIGDVMMDTYLWGKVERISPEAPVPIVSIHKKENRLGGAANVALNIQALGATPIICSVIGNDAEGTDFLNLLKNQTLSAEGIIQEEYRTTTVKTRVIGHNQQIVRVDSETDKNISESSSNQLIERITKIITSQKIDAIIFEDYDKGVITEDLIWQIVTIANQKNIITVVDPKKRNFSFYQNVTLFKPNLKELKEGLKLEIDPRNPHEIESAVNLLQDKLGAKILMVTLSELGVFISSENGRKIIPAHIRNIADVSGAGDTVIATAALCLASGMDEFKTSALANLAGGLVCEQVGVVPISYELLSSEAGNLLD
ncbi:MAG: bifunctional ADP-heptose synthase [Daejeonella sp.]